MRAPLALAVAGLSCFGLQSPADAAPGRTNRTQVCDYRTGTYACYPRRKAQSDEMDEIKAHSLDPAGDYKGYPAWARRALSPKFDNGFR